MADLTLIQKIVVWIIPILFAISLHEVAHGFVASLCGDQTAKISGRLSINPMRHIDPIGTILVPLLVLSMSSFIFGWAKPVPIDPRNFRHPRRDLILVALAGPLANILLAFLFGFLTKLGLLLHYQGYTWIGKPLTYIGGAGIMINVVLAVLNLIPLPPLDGSKLLANLLPPRAALFLSYLEPYSILILLLLMITGLLSQILSPPVFFLTDLISDVFNLI